MRSSFSENQQNALEVSAASPEGLTGSFYFVPASYEYILADPDIQARSTLSVSEASSSRFFL